MSDWVCATIIDDDANDIDYPNNHNKKKIKEDEEIEIAVVKKTRKYTKRAPKTKVEVEKEPEAIVIECLLKKF